ncbi:unnamed protein product [Rodentolepis nana]|uniref:Ubiquitinyl hydrolase 1 n=1 Tax=Rodentolepis nana TaxID=102285 RepID=A0A0R3THT0_RODNA|nr:unnamed protein product [Rodentolepis nana]
MTVCVFGIFSFSSIGLQVLMFPEGTDLSAYGLTRSDAYAKKMCLPLYRYTLHPRTTGFESFVRALGPNLGYVYDVTVAYPYAITESELKMALGDCPQEVHFYVRRWAANQLPPLADKPAVTRDDSSEVSSTPSPLAKWLQDRWAEKEQMLKDFYGQQALQVFWGVRIIRNRGSLSIRILFDLPRSCQFLLELFVFLLNHSHAELAESFPPNLRDGYCLFYYEA